MSFTLSTNFFPREDASELLSAGLTALRTAFVPLCIKALNDKLA